MSEEQYKEFLKRYDKFKKNNLPTPFWDEDRQTFEYVYFYNGIGFEGRKIKNSLETSHELTGALAEITCTGFYYPFTSKDALHWKEKGKITTKIKVGYNHAHTFEGVVRALYDSPETFSISKEDEEFYSKQELDYLRRVQKYLLFIGIKDLETWKAPVSRYRNSLQKKYASAYIYRLKDNVLNKILSGQQNFLVSDWYPEYPGDEKYKPREYCALITDLEDNFKLFVEFTKKEVKEYKDIKNIIGKEDLKDNDKMIVKYFKVLEIFDN